MTTKRRQSSTLSEDLSRYEFVDYTSVSNFEKFTTTLEETLCSWGVKDESFGIFSKEQLLNHSAAISHPSAQEFTRVETVTMGEDTYQLEYHYHPVETPLEETFPLAGNSFFQFGLQHYHPLHRWTGLDRIFILKPINDSIKQKLFNAGGKSTVDIHQAKQLLSACAIAFQNVDCKVPVFVPIGQSKHNMYIGYMRNSIISGALVDTEIRCNMSLTIPPNPQLSYLDGLKSLFIQKLNAQYQDHGLLGYNGENIWISAVYTYNLKNWFDENWKDWDEEIASVKEKKRRISFSDDFDSWGDEDDDSTTENTEQQKQQEITSKVNYQPTLEFGSFNDPLRTLTLSALFSLSKETFFDDAYQTNMDALTAKQWQISREFAPINQQRAYLSTLLEQVVDSWIKDPTNKDYLAPYDDSNNDSTSDSISLMRNLFTAGSAINNPGMHTMANVNQQQQQQVNFFKSDQVENVISALFQPTKTMTSQNEDESTSKSKFMTAKKLGLRLTSSSSVPYRSFLWNLLFYSLEEIASSTAEAGKKQNFTKFFTFLKIVWLDVLRKLRWHWENLVPIPDLNPYLYESSTSTKSDDELSKTLGIDLRYNILHQKISMVNCCIHRRLQNAPQNGNIEDHVIKPKKNVGHLFDSVSADHEQAQKQSKTSKFQNMIESFVDGVAAESLGANDESVLFDPSDIDDANSEDSDVFLDAVEDEANLSSDIQSSTKKESIPSSTMAESFVSLPFIPSTNSAEEAKAEAASIKDADAAEGMSHIHESLKLLKTGQAMQIPITQDPGFMTEDMISEQADVFERLGTSENATHQRAKLQSAQLYSDMQAFKAANPHACLEDFVRWHSPRDWISETGQLSTRMSEPNNIWQELWKCSQRIPCSRQKPLFNMAVEAEKALYFLETTSVHEMFSIMLPTLGLIAYDTLSSHPIGKYSKHVSSGLVDLGTELIVFPWEDLRHGKRTFEGIVSRVRQQESIMCHAISLLRKLPGQYDLVDQLLFNDQAIVKEGDERSAVFQLFRNDHGTISQPSFREYLLYNDCKELASIDRILPARQYAIVKDNEVRILDLQTKDALYNT